MERLPLYLQKSKHDPPPTFEDLQYEIGRLRQEVALHQEAQEAFMGLFSDTREVYQLLRDALIKASSRHCREPAFLELAYDTQSIGLSIRQCLQRTSHRLSTSESRLLCALGIYLDDTASKDCIFI
ncbi:hypothetical protein N7492_002071 [Penicillium capsulatum]|uniref:Uncharacterized protein n=1 Tax=Penicillium capsulatum TaxID=69766 RepID=A0A9W9INC1_9EURO|nr:hypothetical protein N7492_002071 [Penicillium capsulatum]